MNKITVLAEITRLEKDAAEATRKAQALREYLGGVKSTKTPGGAKGRSDGASSKTGGKKRTRRTAEEVRKQAEDLAKYIKASKDGRSGGEINAHLGGALKGITTIQYLERHFPGEFKKTGKLRDTRYLAK